MTVWRLLALVPAFLLVGTSCHLEDRTPAGSRRDDAAIRAVITTYYEALASGDLGRYRELFAPGAVVQGPVPADAAAGTHSVLAFDSLVAGWRGAGMPTGDAGRIIRTDVRQRNGVATAWVTVDHDTFATAQEHVDLFVLERYGAGWRILLLTPMPGGTVS